MDKEQQTTSIEPSAETEKPNKLDELVQPISDTTDQPTQKAIIGVRESSFSGPLPPPEILQGYESVLPGSAERIFVMAEKEQQYRLESVSSSLRTRNHLEYLGWFSSTLITGVLLVGGFVLLYTGISIAGYVALAGSAASLVYAFFQRTPRKNTNKELLSSEN